MTSSIHTVKDAAEQGRGGGCCLGDITAEAGLAGAGGDVTHLQAALLSFEPRLALGERSRRAESCVWKKKSQRREAAQSTEVKPWEVRPAERTERLWIRTSQEAECCPEENGVRFFRGEIGAPGCRHETDPCQL